MYCGIIHMPVERSCHYFIFSVILAPHPADAGFLIFSKEPPNCHIQKERGRVDVLFLKKAALKTLTDNLRE